MLSILKELFNILPSANIKLKKEENKNIIKRNNEFIKKVNKKINKNFLLVSKNFYFKK